MYYVYVIESDKTDSWYIGYTKNYKLRWNAHTHACNSGKKSKLYDCIRKYGIENFELVLISVFDNKIDALSLERSLISLDDKTCLNLVPGGEGGFVIQDKSSWCKKLSKSREGRKPALGMSHTKENKKKFSEASKRRWDIYGRYPTDITSLSFKKARTTYGISKTHYYRLLKQAKINDLG